MARAKPRTGSGYDQGEWVRVAGVDVWVVRAGPRGGTPIVFLHGIPTSAYLWREVMRALDEDEDCIAFDWPGFGSSAKPRTLALTHEERAEQLLAFVDALALPKVNLVVHDLGGPAGLLFAVRYPDRIEKLVVLNTTIYKTDYKPPLPAVAQFIPVVRSLTRPFFTRATFDHFLKQGLARPDQLPRSVLDAHWKLARQEDGVRSILASWSRIPDGAASIREIRTKMGSFPRPVLVLFGAEDPFLPPRNAERLAKDFPQGRLHLVPGAGHFVQEDAPEVVAERLAEFFA